MNGPLAFLPEHVRRMLEQEVASGRRFTGRTAELLSNIGGKSDREGVNTGAKGDMLQTVNRAPMGDRGDNTAMSAAMTRALEQLRERQASGQPVTGQTAAWLQHFERERDGEPVEQVSVVGQSDSPAPQNAALEPPQPQQEAIVQPAAAPQAQAPTPPTNSLRAHIGDPGDAIRALRDEPDPVAPGVQSQPIPASASPSLAPQPLPTAAEAPEAGGILSGLFGKGRDADGWRMGLGAMMAGWAAGATPQESIALGAGNLFKWRQVYDERQRKLTEKQQEMQLKQDELNMTRELAVQLGVDPEIAKRGTKDTLGPIIADAWKRQNEGPKMTDDMREYEYARSQGFQGSFADFQQEMRRAGASQVNIDQKTESAFDKKSAEKQAERFDAIVQDGFKADQMVADVQGLRDIATRITTGKTAEITAALGPYAEALGVKIEGLGDMQAFEAIAARVAPSLRTPGVGAMSDFELRSFIKALPTLGKTPQGNQIIADTLDAMAQHKKAAAEIASLAIGGQLDRQEAERQLRELPDPLTLFKQSQKGSEEPAEGDISVGTTAVNPQTGDRIRWNGSDWEPVQ